MVHPAGERLMHAFDTIDDHPHVGIDVDELPHRTLIGDDHLVGQQAGTLLPAGQPGAVDHQANAPGDEIARRRSLESPGDFRDRDRRGLCPGQPGDRVEGEVGQEGAIDRDQLAGRIEVNPELTTEDGHPLVHLTVGDVSVTVAILCDRRGRQLLSRVADAEGLPVASEEIGRTLRRDRTGERDLAGRRLEKADPTGQRMTLERGPRPGLLGQPDHRGGNVDVGSSQCRRQRQNHRCRRQDRPHLHHRFRPLTRITSGTLIPLDCQEVRRARSRYPLANRPVYAHGERGSAGPGPQHKESAMPISPGPGFTLGLFVALLTVGIVHAKGTQVTTVAQVAGGTGGVVVDAAGNVYSADFGEVLGGGGKPGTRLFRIAPDGSTAVFAEGFRGASGVAIDRHGNFFQSNIRGGYVSKVTPAGEVSTFASEGLQAPVGIVIDEQDTLWVANCGSGSIQKVASDGTSSRFVESPLFKCPNGITMDDAGNLYTANFYNGDVVKITPKGQVSVLATLPGENNGHIVHVDGTLYVIARSAHQVYEVSLTGEIKLFAGSGEKGGQDGKRLEASFCYPNDIAISPDGKTLYVNEVAVDSTDGKLLAPTRVRALKRR